MKKFVAFSEYINFVHLWDLSHLQILKMCSQCFQIITFLQILEINQLWYCLVLTGQTVFLSSFKHLSSKHCNLFYILEIYMRICNWPWLIVNALFLDDLGNATGKNIGLACKYQAISKLVYLKKNCKNVMIGKRFFVNWLHIFKMKKLRHVESDKLSAGYFYFGLNAQKQKKGWGTGHMSPF